MDHFFFIADFKNFQNLVKTKGPLQASTLKLVILAREWTRSPGFIPSPMRNLDHSSKFNSVSTSIKLTDQI